MDRRIVVRPVNFESKSMVQMLKRSLNVLVLILGLGSSLAVFATRSSVTTPGTSTPGLVPVVEFYNADLDHYFITANPAEAAALDSGVLKGWTRTGYQFLTHAADPLDSSLNAVCRFYGKPSAGLDSHFYSASPDECAAVLAKFAASWQLESNDVFQVQMPDASGVCPRGALPVYRLFNGRADANHRYTGDDQVRASMLATGYTPEGYGPDGVAFCSSTTASTVAQPTIASISVSEQTPNTFAFAGVVMTAIGVTTSSYA